MLRGTKDRQLASSAIPVTAPLPTITAGGEHIALVEPIWLDLAHTKNDGVSGTVNEPINTITCSHGTHALISPSLRPLFIPQHGGGTVKPTTAPLSTIATTGSIGVVSPFIMAYYGNGFTTSVHEPLPTISTKDRFGLIQGQILTMEDGRKYQLDITHRMLTAKELAAATGFPDGYMFAGGDTAAKKQIGNAVCPNIASALYRAFLAA